MQDDGGVILGVDMLIDVIFERQNISSEGLEWFDWFLADGMEGFEVSIDFFDVQTGDEGQQVKPVGADVAHRAQSPAQVWFEAPVPVGGEEHPVLLIRTLQDEHVTQFSTLHHAARLLGEGVHADVEVDYVDQLFLRCQFDQFS